MVYDRKEREESLQESDPFAIPEGLTIGDTYKVPFSHPKKGEVEITIFIKEGDGKGQPMRCIKHGDAVLLTRKSRDTASEMFKGIRHYTFKFMGNVKLLRYDDVREAIAAAHRPIKDSPAS